MVWGDEVRIKLLMSLSILLFSLSPLALAQIKSDVNGSDPGANELRAKKIYERLAGVKVAIDDPVIKKMAAFIAQGQELAAAQLATESSNFYNVTVKVMALALSTREESVKTPFNDFAAGFIGITRDDRDARELLTGNFYYRANESALTKNNLIPDILRSNTHYAELESRRVDLSKALYRVDGQELYKNLTETVPNPDPAGLLTSRTFIAEHATGGTNRRLVEFAFREFMCVPLSEWADSGAPDTHIGRDIDRFPGGDHPLYLTSCKSCHTVMDGFRGAFARWDTDGNASKNSQITPTTREKDHNFINADANGVVPKMNINSSTFPAGRVVTDNKFVNYATRPANSALFGWRTQSNEGQGAKDFGVMLANSRRFSQCMAKRVFETVCRKNLDAVQSKALLIQWGNEFESSGYKLKKLFESMAIKPECLN